MIPLVFPWSLASKSFVISLYFKSAYESNLLPQDSSSLEKESVMDEGNMSTPLCFSSWEGKEREIKFNEYFYYVPGALHMLFHFNPPTSLAKCFLPRTYTNKVRLKKAE